MRKTIHSLVLTMTFALSAGCAHVPEKQPPSNAAVFRLELLNAEAVASTLSLYSATHGHACWEQVKATSSKLNVAARNYFLLAEYPHPTTQATALILGRKSVREAIASARECTGAFVGERS